MEREQHFEQQRQRIAIALNIDNTGPVKPAKRGGRNLLPTMPKRSGPSPCKGKPRPNAEVERDAAGEIVRKRCGRCGKMLPVSKYTRKRKAWMAICKPCHAAYHREYWVRRRQAAGTTAALPNTNEKHEPANKKRDSE